jgi:hypothetical protein
LSPSSLIASRATAVSDRVRSVSSGGKVVGAFLWGEAVDAVAELTSLFIIGKDRCAAHARRDDGIDRGLGKVGAKRVGRRGLTRVSPSIRAVACVTSCTCPAVRMSRNG